MKKIKIACALLAVIVLAVIVQYFNGNPLGCWLISQQTQLFLNQNGYDNYEVSGISRDIAGDQSTTSYIYTIWITNTEEKFISTIQRKTLFSNVDKNDLDGCIKSARKWQLGTEGNE